MWYNTNPKGVVLQLSYICQFRDCRRGPPRSHGGTLCPWTFLGESGYVCKIWSWSVQSFCSFPTFVNFGISVGGPQCHVGESYYAHELSPRIWNPSFKDLWIWRQSWVFPFTQTYNYANKQNIDGKTEQIIELVREHPHILYNPRLAEHRDAQLMHSGKIIIFARRYFRGKIIFAEGHCRVTSVFAKMSCRENISN